MYMTLSTSERELRQRNTTCTKRAYDKLRYRHEGKVGISFV